MIKLMKLFSWLKGHWKLSLAIVAVVVIAFGALQGVRANKWHNKHLRLEGKLEEQIADQNRYYEEVAKLRVERRIKEAEEKQKRKDLNARIEKFQKDTVIRKRALREEKEKTATLPATELVMQINERIGEESSLTGAGLFLFTRLGTNRTLDKFKDGEFYLSEYNKFQGVLANHEAEVESFNTSIGKCEEQVGDNLEGWNDCRTTLATAQQSIVTEKKKGKASVWRGRKQGAFWTIVIGGGLKLLGVW